MIDFLIGVVAALLMIVLLVPSSYERGKQDVINACRSYNQYYIEPPTDKDPMGYYMECHVSAGPYILPNSKEGKKK